MPLGRFLEVSLAAADVAESLAFYEALGFVQATVGEAWRHPYAVVTDGRLSIGLHGGDFESPLPTWVAPSLRERVDALTGLGVEIAEARLDDLSLHEVRFRDPSGQLLRVLEARTFSSPDLPPGHTTALGYFEEFAIATASLAEASAFWERLGFVAFEPLVEPVARAVASSRDLNVGLYAVDLSASMLVFTAADMAARITRLRQQGLRFSKRLPRALAAIDAAVLEAPEGTQLLLLAEAADA